MHVEIVTYVEAKFGLNIRDSKPSDAGFREHSNPLDVGAVNSFSSGKGKWSSGPRDAVHHIFIETAIASKNTAKQSSGKGNQSKSWSTSEPSISGKGKSKENHGKSKGLSKGTKSENKGSKGAKCSCKGKTAKTGISGLENLKSETCSETQESVQMGQVYTTDTSWIHDEWSPDEWNDGWSLDDWNDDWSCVGWHEDCEQTHDTSVSSFSLESSEWAKMNLDSGAAVNTFPSNFGPGGIGDGDENGLPRSLNGRLTGVHKFLCSAAEIACKRRQDFYLGHDGGSDSQRNWSGNELAIEVQPRIVAEKPLEVERRRFYVLSADIEAHGHMGSCPGYALLTSQGKVTKPRRVEFVERVGTTVEKTLTGEARIYTCKDRAERREELELSEVQWMCLRNPGTKMMSRWRFDMRTYLAVTSPRTNTKRKE